MLIGIDCRDGFTGEQFPCSWQDGKLILTKPGAGTMIEDFDSPEDAIAALKRWGYRAQPA